MIVHVCRAKLTTRVCVCACVRACVRACVCVRVSVCLSDTTLSSAKRLNRSMCRSVVDSGRPTEPCIMTGTKSPSTTRVLLRGSSWAFPDVWVVDIYSTYWRYSPGGCSDVASGYQYRSNLFMLFPLLLMAIVTMMVMMTLWLCADYTMIIVVSSVLCAVAFIALIVLFQFLSQGLLFTYVF